MKNYPRFLSKEISKNWKLFRSADSTVSMFSSLKKENMFIFLISCHADSIPRIVKFRRWNSWKGRERREGRDSRRFYVSWIVRRMNILIRARRHSWRGRDYNYQRTAHYDGYRISDVSRIHYLWITNKPPIVFPCDIFVVICHLTGECGQMVMFMLLIPLCIVKPKPNPATDAIVCAQFHASKRKYLYALCSNFNNKRIRRTLINFFLEFSVLLIYDRQII